MAVSIAEIEAIPEKCVANVPGVSSVLLIKSNVVLFIPSAIDGTLSGNITIASGESPVEWNPTKGTAIFNDERKTNEDFGDYYETRLAFDLPKIDSLKFRQHINAANLRLSAIVTDENGVSRFAHRLKHRSKSTTGGQGQRNGYEWEFVVESRTPAFLFTGQIVNL